MTTITLATTKATTLTDATQPTRPVAVRALIAMAAFGMTVVGSARARWSAFAVSGQLGPSTEREIGRRTGGRI